MFLYKNLFFSIYSILSIPIMLIGINGGYFPAICRVCHLMSSGFYFDSYPDFFYDFLDRFYQLTDLTFRVTSSGMILDFKWLAFLSIIASVFVLNFYYRRYLIFFDSGEVQYVPHGSVWHLFVDTEPGDVWTEFVDGEMGSFLEVYFHFYPKRFLLQDTVQGKVIKVKDYGRWYVLASSYHQCHKTLQEMSWKIEKLLKKNLFQ